MSEEIDLGNYVVGEIPPPLVYQFLDSTGAPMNLTGYQARFQFGLIGAGAPFESVTTMSGSWEDAATGKVRYIWNSGDFASPGRHVGMFWVGNGTNRYASIRIEWDVCLAPDAAPAI